MEPIIPLPLGLKEPRWLGATSLDTLLGAFFGAVAIIDIDEDMTSYTMPWDVVSARNGFELLRAQIHLGDWGLDLGQGGQRKLKVQIVDFPGGMPGYVGITLKWV